MPIADTSLIAYDRIVDKLGKCQLEVLKCIRIHGPLTNKEISSFMNKEINKITGRTKELRDKGLVQQHGTKVIDGFPAKTWEASYPTELF